jgi:extracellular elastinolytic metalloproteinase
MQIVFDAYLLMPSAVSMVEARDAYLTADRMRFGGANQAALWNAFARRGLGEGASSNTNADPDPVPSFTSPFLNEARVRFRPVDDDGNAVVGQLFVGRYEGRAVPVADTDPATALGDTFRIVPGTYDLVARANGFGAKRLSQRFTSGQRRTLTVELPRNLASAANGATASGDGVDLPGPGPATSGCGCSPTSAPARPATRASRTTTRGPTPTAPPPARRR